MKRPLIDVHSGSLHFPFPDGGEIQPGLTLDAFQASPAHAVDRKAVYGAPWWRYDFSAGRMDGKEFHDSLLERILGKPAKIGVSPSSSPGAYPVLDRSLEWIFPWGAVSSLFVGQSCSSLIMVRYGNRRKEANKPDRGRG